MSAIVIAAGETFEDQMYQAYGATEVAGWNFDEGSSTTAYDSSGNGNDLTLDQSDGTVTWASTTAAFRGTSALSILPGSTVSVPAGGVVNNFDPTNGSISFWVNLASVGSNGIFCSQPNPADPDYPDYYQFCIFDSGAKGHFIGFDWAEAGASAYGGVNRMESDIDPATVLNTWTQVAVSWNIPLGAATGTVEIYINGKEEGSTDNYSYDPTAFLSPFSFCIGGACDQENINGTIDEMRVYSQSLQSGEIEKIYAEELPAHMVADTTHF